MMIKQKIIDSHIGLLIVDMQYGFNPDQKIVSNINLIAKQYSTVVPTKFFNQYNSLYRKVFDWDKCSTVMDTKLLLDFKPKLIINKNGYSFDSVGIKKFLKISISKNITEWHLCGFQTDACILACAYSIWDIGLRPFLYVNLCSTENIMFQKSAIEIFARQFGKDSLLNKTL